MQDCSTCISVRTTTRLCIVVTTAFAIHNRGLPQWENPGYYMSAKLTHTIGLCMRVLHSHTTASRNMYYWCCAGLGISNDEQNARANRINPATIAAIYPAVAPLEAVSAF